MNLTPALHLMLATEATEQDEGAQGVALALASQLSTRLEVALPLLSNPEYEAVAPQTAARMEGELAARGLAFRQQAKAMHVELEWQVCRGAQLHECILARARQCQAELLILRRRGKRSLLSNLLVGEMVGRVLAQAPCSVLVVPRLAAPWQQAVLVGIAPEQPAAPLLNDALALARLARLPLHVVTVVTSESAHAAALARLHALLAEINPPTPLDQVHLHARVGEVASELLACTHAARADLLVLGRSRTSGGRSVLPLGASTQLVLGRTEVSVLIHDERHAIFNL